MAQSKLTFPLYVAEGTSRYKPGEQYYYLNDSAGNLLGGTQDLRKVELWRELCHITTLMTAGQPLDLLQVTRVVGYKVEVPLRTADPTPDDDQVPF